MSKRNGSISEDKARRIAVGATVGGVLLIVFLFIILIVQFVQIGVRNSEAQRLDDEIGRYEQLIGDERENLEWYRTGSGLYFLARRNGWK